MSSLKRAFLFALIVASATLAASASAFGAGSSKTALLLDEPPVVPMRVEADIFAQLALEIDPEIALLAPTDQGIVRRDGTPVDLGDFDRLWIFQGDKIVQNSALFALSPK